MNTSEIFLIAMTLILTVPFLIWRVGRTEYYAPLVVQIITGILLGPGIVGAVFPQYYAFVFNPQVIQALNGIAWWAVMTFVWIAAAANGGGEHHADHSGCLAEIEAHARNHLPLQMSG